MAPPEPWHWAVYEIRRCVVHPCFHSSSATPVVGQLGYYAPPPMSLWNKARNHRLISTGLSYRICSAYGFELLVLWNVWCKFLSLAQGNWRVRAKIHSSERKYRKQRTSDGIHNASVFSQRGRQIQLRSASARRNSSLERNRTLHMFHMSYPHYFPAIAANRMWHHISNDDPQECSIPTSSSAKSWWQVTRAKASSFS